MTVTTTGGRSLPLAAEPDPNSLLTPENVWAHYKTLADAGDMDTAFGAMRRGELTPDQVSDLHRRASESEAERGEATQPTGAPAPWTQVSSMADIRKLRRFIPVHGRRLGTATIAGRTGTPTFSHPEGAQNKCGGFELESQSAEQFVRQGGVCQSHKLTRTGKILPRYQSLVVEQSWTDG